MPDYLEMLSYRRPHRSQTEEDFISRYLPFDQDDFGNVVHIVGKNPKILFSSHTDTMHHREGFQALQHKAGLVWTKDPLSNCLGADCTSGIWIMLNMIAANQPGIYVFHRGEERGMLGSRFITDTPPAWLTSDTAPLAAIAFDRRGTADVITEQLGRPCCSIAFAKRLGDLLGPYHRPAQGIYTDTAMYVGFIQECTNVSVGYSKEHTSHERQNIDFLQRLSDTAIQANWESILC